MKYYIDNPGFGVWNEDDEFGPDSGGTISNNINDTDNKDFFCPKCYFGKPRKYTSVLFKRQIKEDDEIDDEDVGCPTHGVIEFWEDDVKEQIQNVNRDIRNNR